MLSNSVRGEVNRKHIEEADRGWKFLPSKEPTLIVISYAEVGWEIIQSASTFNWICWQVWRNIV